MQAEIWRPLTLVLGSLGALGCLLGALWALKRKRLIDDLPTSKTQGVFIGLVELKGTAESEMPLTSYLAETRCVQYAWQIDEHWSRTVHETYTDAQGHVRSRTRTESGWTKVAGDEQSIPFYLKDDTGVLRIVPEGATIHGTTTFNETFSPGNSLYYGKGPAREIANSTHRRRFHETALPLHTMLYVMGQARERQDIVAPEIARDRNAPMFMISTRTEKQLSTGYAWWSWLWLTLGLGVTLGGAGVWKALEKPVTGLSWQPYVVAAGGFMAVLALGWVWVVQNSLISLHHRVEQGWSQVDVELKRRHDLIPGLVNIVEGYRAYEQQTQTLLAELRRQSELVASGTPNPDLKGIAPALRVVVEHHPELKASESFLKLQRALADAEQRIALARDYFNGIATFYNTRLDIIPDRFVAAVAGLRPQALMGAAEFERVPVQVKLVS